MNFKPVISLISILVVGIACVGSIITNPASADGSINDQIKDELSLVVNDIKYVEPPVDNTSAKLKASIDKETERELHADDLQIDQAEPEVVEYVDATYDYDDTYYDDAYYDDSYYTEYDDSCYNTEGLTASSGVNYYNGRQETYYSSNVLYHYRTSEWTAGDDGVYRDADGYVVVAANENEYSEGDVIDTSFGPAKVYDSGCDYGITDVYVNW